MTAQAHHKKPEGIEVVAGLTEIIEDLELRLKKLPDVDVGAQIDLLAARRILDTLQNPDVNDSDPVRSFLRAFTLVSSRLTCEGVRSDAFERLRELTQDNRSTNTIIPDDAATELNGFIRSMDRLDRSNPLREIEKIQGLTVAEAADSLLNIKDKLIRHVTYNSISTVSYSATIIPDIEAFRARCRSLQGEFPIVVDGQIVSLDELRGAISKLTRIPENMFQIFRIDPPGVGLIPKKNLLWGDHELSQRWMSKIASLCTQEREDGHLMRPVGGCTMRATPLTKTEGENGLVDYTFNLKIQGPGFDYDKTHTLSLPEGISGSPLEMILRRTHVHPQTYSGKAPEPSGQVVDSSLSRLKAELQSGYADLCLLQKLFDNLSQAGVLTEKVNGTSMTIQVKLVPTFGHLPNYIGRTGLPEDKAEGFPGVAFKGVTSQDGTVVYSFSINPPQDAHAVARFVEENVPALKGVATQQPENPDLLEFAQQWGGLTWSCYASPGVGGDVSFSDRTYEWQAGRQAGSVVNIHVNEFVNSCKRCDATWQLPIPEHLTALDVTRQLRELLVSQLRDTTTEEEVKEGLTRVKESLQTWCNQSAQ